MLLHDLLQRPGRHRDGVRLLSRPQEPEPALHVRLVGLCESPGAIYNRHEIAILHVHGALAIVRSEQCTLLNFRLRPVNATSRGERRYRLDEEAAPTQVMLKKCCVALV